VLLDPPVVPFELISLEASDPNQQPFPSLELAIAAIRATYPTWTDGDVRAKAESSMQLDIEAARAVLLDNGDWDGGLADLREFASEEIDTWLIRGDPAFGSYVDDEAAAEFEELLGRDHIITIPGSPHSPQRTHPVETVAAILRALGGPGAESAA
jgi:pimeloyl-ACP methyl ester carboxylesterase